MKKIFYFILIALVGFAPMSCDSELDRLWQNPNKYTPAPDEVTSGLFTNMQKTRFWKHGYGEWYYYCGFSSFMEVAQIATAWPYATSYNNRFADDNYGVIEEFMSMSNGNLTGRFNWFYTDLTNYGLIRDEVAVLTGEKYDDAVIYQRLATVLKDVVALQTVDLYNSIPYFSSFKGSEGVFFTPYDEPLEIYKSVIEEYRAIAAELPGLYNKMSPIAKNVFETQDLFFKGDITKWVQYINAECLKACMRISGVAADYVKPFIAEAIKDLPKEDFTFTCPDANQARPTTSGNGGIKQRGMYENYYTLAIPDVILMRMNRGTDIYEPTIDDPRLPVIAMGFTRDGTANNVEYYGVSMNWDRNNYLRNLPNDHPDKKWNVTPQNSPAYYVTRPAYPMDQLVASCPWTFYNPVTMVLSEAPLYVMSRTESDLFLAEAVLKGLASTGKTADAHINDAVKHSIDFWYMMNGVPNYAGDMSAATKQILTPSKPSAAIIDAYAATIQNEFSAAGGEEDKMEILMQQKYIHLNVWEVFEAFAELRRTRHPKLEPITNQGTDRTLVNQTMMLERFRLPSSERSTNFDEYSKVMAVDKFESPIFWVPQNKINEKYFRSSAIKAPLP